ncbi:hypothetical protein TKK_0013711 [Trichogramma kaykai]|uniref:BEN domain-containing protein n=1 Tax=Trichogramma kaykai TaxID=54128 RepID=A0ABD2WGW8_9HYME
MSGAKKTEYDRFVRSVTMAFFEPEELKGSSVSGKRSNAKPDSEAKPSIDPTRLSAIHDIFAHYLEKVRNKNTVEIFEALAKVGACVGTKISELRRPPRKPRAPKKVKPKVSDVKPKESEESNDSNTSDSSEESDDSSSQKSNSSDENEPSDTDSSEKSDSNKK